MITATLDTRRAQGRMIRMLGQLDTFGSDEMPEEFLGWHRDDLNSRWPHVEAVDRKTAMIRLYPRSRGRVGARVSAGRSGRRRTGVKPPVLRPEMFELLCERMAELMGRVLRWR